MNDIANIGAERAKRSNNAADWTPLECLEDVVSRIKAGDINPNNLVVCFTEPNDNVGLTDVRFSASCPNVIIGTGILHRAVHLMGTENVLI